MIYVFLMHSCSIYENINFYLRCVNNFYFQFLFNELYISYLCLGNIQQNNLKSYVDSYQKK